MGLTRVIVLEGLFCVGKNPKLTASPMLHRELWSPSAKAFRLCDLHVMDNMVKHWGRWYFNEEVHGVVDLSSRSPTPFFIPKKKANELRAMLSRVKR